MSPRRPMPICCKCDADIDVDEFDIERGDELSCSECGANLLVSAVSPVEFEPAEPEADDDDPDGDADDDWE